MISVTITINETDELKRFQNVIWKQGRSMEQPQLSKQINNFQADYEDTTDRNLMHSSFMRWLMEGGNIMREYVTSGPVFNDTTRVATITLAMPQNWGSHSAPGLTYALRELIFNGLMSEWHGNLKPDTVAAYKKAADLNRAEIQSIVYSLGAPEM